MGAELKGLWLAEIKGEIRAEATKSWTSELGVVTSGKVLPGKTVYGKCGIMKENMYGYSATRYSNCTVGNKVNMSVYAPYREGGEFPNPSRDTDLAPD
jgi:hypothetical protein